MRASTRTIAVLSAIAAAALGTIMAIPAASNASAAGRTPVIIITPRPTLTLRLYPDFTIGRAGGCTWYRGGEGDVWLNPTIEAHATGYGIPASVGFNMVSNFSSHTAGGALASNVAQTWAIDIGPATRLLAALGHYVTLTLNVDPGNEVAESNEANNTAYITVNLTSYTTPPGTAEVAVPCS